MIPKTLPHHITGEKTVLRRIQQEDAEPFYRFLSHPDNIRYMFYTDNQTSYQGAKQLVGQTIASYDSDDPSWIFAITDKNTGDYLGHCGAYSMDENPNDTEFFYTLLPEYRGMGYVTDAVIALLSYLFEHGIQTAVAIIVIDNDASKRVMERLGARFAGDYEVHTVACHRYEIDRGIYQTWS